MLITIDSDKPALPTSIPHGPTPIAAGARFGVSLGNPAFADFSATTRVMEIGIRVMVVPPISATMFRAAIFANITIVPLAGSASIFGALLSSRGADDSFSASIFQGVGRHRYPYRGLVEDDLIIRVEALGQ